MRKCFLSDQVSKVSYLPDWLQSLIMCCFEVSEFDIQSSAVGTLLDLINLTLSVNAGHAHGPRSPAPGVVIPMISKQSLGVIEKSDLYEVVYFRNVLYEMFVVNIILNSKLHYQGSQGNSPRTVSENCFTISEKCGIFWWSSGWQP